MTRLWNTLVSFAKGPDVQNVCGLWSGLTEAEAVGGAVLAGQERFPGYALRAANAWDCTDQARSWVAANPPETSASGTTVARDSETGSARQLRDRDL